MCSSLAYAGEVQATRMSHVERDECQQCYLLPLERCQLHNMLSHVSTCATSFHQLNSMRKLALVGTAQPINASKR